jgi:hypothetical protein
MWKISWSPVLLVLVTVLLLGGPSACSGSKDVRKPAQRTASVDRDLVSLGPEDVTKRLGEPTAISKTPEGHVLWVYEPKWKLLPNNKGTVYVEFEEAKVTRVFKIR